jgi:hypothetical protein
VAEDLYGKYFFKQTVQTETAYKKLTGFPPHKRIFDEAYAIERADGTNALEFGPSSSAPLHTMQASLTLRYLARIGA